MWLLDIKISNNNVGTTEFTGYSVTKEQNLIIRFLDKFISQNWAQNSTYVVT